MTKTNLEIIRRGCDSRNNSYLLVQSVDGGRSTETWISIDDIGSRSSKALSRLGLLSSSAIANFRRMAEEALQDMPVDTKIIDRSGFHGDTFVWPTGEMSGNLDRFVCLPTDQVDRAGPFRTCGNLKEWRRLGELALGNSCFMLALSLTFTGPVCNLMEWEAPMIQLVGRAGIFKTSLASAVTSVWGVEMANWNRTSNACEELALARNASFLVLDDWAPDNREEFFHLRTAAKRVADGLQRGRRGEVGASWCTPVLSTANLSLDEFALQFGVAVSDDDHVAVRGRLLDVRLPHNGRCIVEDLKGYPRAKAFIEETRQIARANQGVAGERLVDFMLAWNRRDPAGLRCFLKDALKRYEGIASARFEDRPGYNLTRAHNRLGIIYAAGALAIRAGILPWSYNALGRALLACEASHLAIVDGAGQRRLSLRPVTREVEAPFDVLRRYIAKRHSEFVDLRTGLLPPGNGHDHDHCPGYIGATATGAAEYLIPSQRIEQICGSVPRYRQLTAELRHHGIHEHGSRPSVRRSVYRGGDRDERVYVMALRASAFTREHGNRAS